MENLLFSVNIILPIFLVMFFGAFLKKYKFISSEFVKNGNSLVFKIILPISLFSSVYKSDLTQLTDIKFLAFSLATTVISCLLLAFISYILFKDKMIVGAVTHGGYRGNFALLGLPLINSIIGAENSAKTVLILVFVVPMYTVLATIVLTICSESDEKINAKKIIKEIIKNPLMIGIFAGVVSYVLKIKYPFVLLKTADYISSLATPFALLCLGGSLNLTSYNPKIKFALFGSIYKVLVQPIIVIFFAYMFGFRGNDLLILLIVFGVSTAVSSYAMTVNMNGDGYIASTIILVSTLLSVFTLTAFISLFKAFGII